MNKVNYVCPQCHWTLSTSEDVELFKEVLDALEIGYAAALVESQRYHQEMKGYRQAEHDKLDADVAQIGKAMTALINKINKIK